MRRRGHRIPKNRHLNLYLVHQAQDIMERAFTMAKTGTPLLEVLGASASNLLPPIVVTHDDNVVGLIPPRSGGTASTDDRCKSPGPLISV